MKKKNRKHHLFCHILVKHFASNPKELKSPKISSRPQKARTQTFLTIAGQENEWILHHEMVARLGFGYKLFGPLTCTGCDLHSRQSTSNAFY
jgi:hypothetical protein